MGCCGSQDTETKRRLTDVEKTIKAAGSPASGSTDGLEDMAKCAKELRSVMDKIVGEGAKDREGIQRIESLSDSILGNLTDRITIDALQKGTASFQPLEEQITNIARELDKVRATKATTIVEQHIQTERGRIETTLEKRAAAPLQQMQATMEKITLGDTKQLVPGCKAVLDLAEQTHGIAPENKKVTDQILKHIVQLSIHILKVESVWIVDLKSCEIIKQVADRLDTIAQNLVMVMGASWDPPMAPQVADVTKATADKVCADQLAAGSKELVAENAGGAYDSLEVILTWWPALKDSSAHNLEIVGMFSKVQTYAGQAYFKATTSSDQDTMTGIKEFAGKFDALRNKFEGLPPPAEGVKLGDKLKEGEAKGSVIKNLSTLDAEIAKTKDDDKSTNLSLAAVVQALEALTSVWPTVKETGADAELSDKVTASFKKIEVWCEGTASKLSPERAGSLLKFAQEYDSRRQKIFPDAPNLRPKLALNAAEKYLKATEAEAAKVEGMKPNILFDSLKSTVDSLPREVDALPDGTMDKLRSRLSAAFVSVDSRIMKTFQETLTSGEGTNERKEDMLMKFASKLDELRAESGITDEEGSASLLERLKGRRQGMADESLTIMEDQLDILVDRPDFDAVLQALCLLEQAWSPELTEDKTLTDRFTKACSSLETRLSEACNKAAGDGDVARADELLELAGELDLAANGVRLKSGDAEEGVNLRSSACKLAVDAHLKIAEAALQQGKLEALTKECTILDKLCSPRVGLSPCPDEACESVLTFVAGLKVPLQNLSAKGGENMEAAMKAAIAADEAAKVARKDKGGDKDGCVAALKIIQGVLKKLEEARVETAKTSGMNPRVVVEILKELEPLWPSACSQEGCQKNLLEVLEKLHAKFEDAGKKAISDEKKLEALLAFSKDADKAQEALVNQSEGISSEKNYVVLARVCADDCLAKMEAELAKDKGMNPAKLLKGVKEMIPFWTAFGNPSAMDPAFDTVAALKERWSALRTKIGTRMAESMADAISSSNDGKKQALLKFAGDFDSECKSISEDVASLEEELRGKADQM